jgi:hypothetical protein
MMRRAAVACLLVSAATLAHAQNADLTKEFQAGIDAFRLGKFDEARAHLEKARDIDPKLPGPYRFLAAVGQAQGKWDDCINSAYKALELNPQSSEAADTRKLYEECRVSAGRPPYRGDLADSAAIAVTTNVTGAAVKINGLTYGATPLAPRPITPGELDVEIEKAGWKSQKLTRNALAGIVTDIMIDLEPDPNAVTNELQTANQVKPDKGWLVLKDDAGQLTIDGAAPKGEPDPKEVGSSRYELTSGTHVIELSAPAKDPWKRRVRISAGQKTVVQPVFTETASRTAVEKRGLYILGASTVLIAGGFVTAMVSQDAAAEARDIVRIETARDASVSTTLVPLRTRADLDDARDKASRFALISNISYGAGLVAAGVGAYYLYKGARERSDVPPPFAIAPTHGGVYIAKEIAW